MNLSLLNQLSEWNPQLSREIKGRFTPRNVILSVAVSGIIQFLILMYFYSKLAIEKTSKYTECTPANCPGPTIDLQWWWQDIFQCLTWMVALSLVLGGVYTLVNDLAKEKSRGTLNFIRLSPQSSQSIFIGKLLGVPSLVYLVISLIMPLFGVAAIQSGAPLLWIVSYGLFVVVSCFLFYGIALLYALTSGNHAWFFSALSAYLLGGMLQLYLQGASWTWFHLTLDNKFLAFQAFILVNLSISYYWIWQALNRRFRNPNATLLSKQQSYYLVAMVQILLLGFWVDTPKDLSTSVGVLIIVNSPVFAILAMTLSPHFQTCTDWARYRHSPNGNNRVQSSLMRDLMWADKSPALLAIALNLAITGIIWITWILFWPSDSDKMQAIVSLVFCGNLILIYAAIAQLMLLMRTPKRVLWTVGTFIATLAVPPVIFSLLSSQLAIAPVFLLISVYGAPWFILSKASTMGIFLAILSQWSILGFLSAMLTRKLQKAGESDSKIKILLPGQTV